MNFFAGTGLESASLKGVPGLWGYGYVFFYEFVTNEFYGCGYYFGDSRTSDVVA